MDDGKLHMAEYDPNSPTNLLQKFEQSTVTHLSGIRHCARTLARTATATTRSCMLESYYKRSREEEEDDEELQRI